jgi:PadR family transcriptional regulator AphA
MSLEFAILGFLNYHPYTGYDLKKIFDTSVRHFWPADQSQIYRTLTQLTKKGYAEMEKVLQEDRPDRKVYHITKAGREALLAWLAGPPPLDEPRSASISSGC